VPLTNDRMREFCRGGGGRVAERVADPREVVVQQGRVVGAEGLGLRLGAFHGLFGPADPEQGGAPVAFGGRRRVIRSSGQGLLGPLPAVKTAVAPLRRGLPLDEPRERPPSLREAAAGSPPLPTGTPHAPQSARTGDG
jgi:hypothetical protein